MEIINCLILYRLPLQYSGNSFGIDGQFADASPVRFVFTLQYFMKFNDENIILVIDPENKKNPKLLFTEEQKTDCTQYLKYAN